MMFDRTALGAAMHEKKVRTYAIHLGLTTREQGGVISLHWRYGDRRKLGEHRSWVEVNQALTKITVDDLTGNH
jgi:hypothetical protein